MGLLVVFCFGENERISRPEIGYNCDGESLSLMNDTIDFDRLDVKMSFRD